MTNTNRKTSRLFTMIVRDIWRSKAFKTLPNDDARFLYFYFLTCPHQTSAGCMVLPDAYALADLDMVGADWTPEKFRAAKQALIGADLIRVDGDTGEILITGWWNDHPPNNLDWFAGAEKQCDAIASPNLRKAAQEALDACRQAFLASKLQTVARGTGGPAALSATVDRMSTRIAR